jgi:SRSO17 transposase
MHEPDAPWLQRLDDFTGRFRGDFRRREQARWAAVYLQGLLREGGRKTIGTMASRVVLPADLYVEDVAQALQHFVNQSPWDEGKLWRRYREMMAVRFADADGTFVLEELAFVKQGRHSVAVQRQYSNFLGRKTNCQIAVVLNHVSRAGYCPLALRLYLPRGWLQNGARLDYAGVPEEFRRLQSRGTITLELLDEVRAEGWPARVVVAANFGSDLDFRSALSARGLNFLLGAAHDPAAAAGQLAHNLSAESAPTQIGQLLECYRLARQGSWTLLDELGLDHFEGRSWRGFHHHACLVALAFAYRILYADKQAHR